MSKFFETMNLKGGNPENEKLTKSIVAAMIGTGLIVAAEPLSKSFVGGLGEATGAEADLFNLPPEMEGVLEGVVEGVQGFTGPTLLCLLVYFGYRHMLSGLKNEN